MANAQDDAVAPTTAPTGVQAPKRVYVRTYGCQMNVYDSARMTDALAPAGYTSVATPEDADLVLLNTCHIREKAAEKVYSELGRLRQLAEARKAAGGRLSIGVAGCVAQAEGAEIARRAPVVDFVVGPQAYHRLPALAAQAEAGERGMVETAFPPEDKFAAIGPRRSVAPASFLTVQEGCDKFCAFCVVPYTRGAEFSRPAAQVLAEARGLLERGAVEITLLGQNVNAYHGRGPDGSDWGLGRLIRALAAEGVRRIRYTTSHPRDMDDDLIAAHADTPQLAPYLHLPVQSGSDRILKAMNRRHDAQTYLDIVARMRAARPDIALSGDFIVGFPGETEADFADTMALVEAVGYAQAYSFKYSERPGTPAADAADQVPEASKADRLRRLQDRLNADQATFNATCVGRTASVLLERRGRREGQLVGRSPWLQAVHVEAPDSLLGRFADVALTAAGPNSMAGRLV
jgi:tRNA-2-methylthio-N6-dimethylallyladenosine synthase